MMMKKKHFHFLPDDDWTLFNFTCSINTVPQSHTLSHLTAHTAKQGTALNPVQVTLSDENFTLTVISRELKIKPKNIILNAILKIILYYNYGRFWEVGSRENTKINCGLDTIGEKEKRMSKKNTDGRSISSCDKKKFRTRSMEKQRGMVFGYQKTVTAVKKPDTQMDDILWSCIRTVQHTGV